MPKASGGNHACPWWDYLWSVRTPLKVGTDGRVPVGTQRLRIEKPPGAKVVLCLHPSGHHSILAAPPNKAEKPSLLFTNRPKINSCFANSKELRLPRIDGHRIGGIMTD